MTTSGFYKFNLSDGLLFAPNGVYGPSFTLLPADQENYSYPIEGWYWFDTQLAAEQFFEINGQFDPNRPNYYGLQSMIGDSPLMDRVTNRLTPVETITSHRNGRAQSGGSNFIVLATGASTEDGAYLGSLMLVPQGTGLNQAFVCIGYNGTTQQADLIRISDGGTPFTLDGTTRYRMYPLEAMHAVAVDAANVWAIERATRRFMNVLERMVGLYVSDGFNSAPGDNATIIARFQTRLNEWVTAVNFNAEDRDALRGYLLQFVPTRGYLVP